MAKNKRIPGLVRRGQIWHIDKYVRGVGRLCESTGAGTLDEAQKFLVHRLAEARESAIYGRRPRRTWRDAATQFLNTHRHLPSIGDCAGMLKALDPYIGDIPLEELDRLSLNQFVSARLDGGVSARTINMSLQLVSRILRKCALEWRDEHKLTWLKAAPPIQLLYDSPREPYPLTWLEQKYLFAELPAPLRAMAEFACNTGTREQEVCLLRWEYERSVDALDATVFQIPPKFGGRRPGSGVKNKKPRLVILNHEARGIIDAQRGKHREWVFPNPRTGKPFVQMNNSAWQRARESAARKWEEDKKRPPASGFARVRVHDLKHTWGCRLLDRDVPYEARQRLLGHQIDSVTAHYSHVPLKRLLEYANRVRPPEAAPDARDDNAQAGESTAESRKSPASEGNEKGSAHGTL